MADNKELIAELRKLSAYIENRGGIRVRVDRSGGCGPATAFECELWDALEAAERDATRYQWIRNKRVNPHAYLPNGEQLDNYMDARLPAPPKKED